MESLHEAARTGDTAKISSLLAQGSKIDGRDKHSRTALHMAAWAGQTKAVETLLAAKASLKATAMDDTNALHFTAQKGHTDTSNLLIESGLSAKSQNRKGQTALHIAASKGHTDLVRLLLEKRADPGVRNRKGQSCFDAASNEEIREMLQEAITRHQERLEKIKASVKASNNEESKKNLRKRPLDVPTKSEASSQQAEFTKQDEPANKNEPMRKRAVILSHLGDEEE